MIKIALLILLFALTSYAQLPDLKSYQLVGTTKDRSVVAMIHLEDKTGNIVVFKGLLARIMEMRGEAIVSLDPDNWSVSTIAAECESKSYAFRDTKGVENGKKYEQVFEPRVEGVVAGSVMESAIKKACGGLKEIAGKDGF